MLQRPYHPVLIVLHWLMFLLIVVALACIETRGWVPRDRGSALRALLMNWHINAGVLILLSAVVRITARARFGVPVSLGSPLQTRLASVLHAILYLIMFLQPLTGMMLSQTAGYEVTLFGMVLPQLAGPDAALHDTLQDLHTLIGNSLYFLIALHILGVLWHHNVLKDETFARMTFK